MYKNKYSDRNNIAGLNIKRFRLQKDPRWSQNLLAAKLELNGLSVNKNAIQRIESGERFVTDIELKAIAELLNVSVDQLLDESVYKSNENNKDDSQNLAPTKKQVHYRQPSSGYGSREIADNSAKEDE
ncbi:MAG: helix-turn-helix domain-containing protein [Treponema sp.]|nr:helix-turn-helix domain-containing protein [Treponema sp.]